MRPQRQNMEPVAQEGPAAHLTAAGKQRRKKKSRMVREQGAAGRWRPVHRLASSHLPPPLLPRCRGDFLLRLIQRSWPHGEGRVEATRSWSPFACATRSALRGSAARRWPLEHTPCQKRGPATRPTTDPAPAATLPPHAAPIASATQSSVRHCQPTHHTPCLPFQVPCACGTSGAGDARVPHGAEARGTQARHYAVRS